MRHERIQGYSKKPWWIYLTAVGFVTVPLVTLLEFGLKVNFSAAIMAELAKQPYFIMETIWALSGAAAVLLVRRASLIYLVGLSFCAVALRLWEYHQDTLLGTPIGAVLVAFWLAVGAAFLGRMRAPYLNPDMRWWTRDERVRFVAYSVLEHSDVKFPTVLLNLSANGAFVKLDERLFAELAGSDPDGAASERRKSDPGGTVMLSHQEIVEARDRADSYPRRLGDRVRLRFEILPEAAQVLPPPVYETDAEVVWTSDPTTDYRFGLGLRFVHRSRAEKRWMRGYLRLLKELGFRTREGRD